MKKQVSAILTAGMAASLLVGCGGGSTSTAPAESTSTAASTEAAAPAESTEAGQAADITLWTYPIGNWGDSESRRRDAGRLQRPAIPTSTVTVEYLDYTNGDDQVNTAIKGGSAPRPRHGRPRAPGCQLGRRRQDGRLERPVDDDDQQADISASKLASAPARAPTVPTTSTRCA